MFYQSDNSLFSHMQKAGFLITRLICFISPIKIIFSSPEPKAHGELIVYQSSRCLSVCTSVCTSVCL